MPVVVQKAKRTPSYVDVPVPETALRREYFIATQNEPRFVRAYLKVSRSIYDPATVKRLRTAIGEMKRGQLTVEDVVNTVDWFNPNDEMASKQWELLGGSLERSFTQIVEDAGQREMNDQGWRIRFQVEKATPFLVPTNPFSLPWIRLKTASLVQEISDQQRSLLREILVESFEEGQRPEAIIEEIERVVGLLSRERNAVEKQRQRLLDEGATEDIANKSADKAAKKLLRKRAKRIARTETVDAYSRGLDDSWQLAKEEGFIEDNAMQEWVELSASPRTCRICQGLGGQKVPVGEPFVSEFIGEVERPPAHPQCRCTRILVFDNSPEDIDAANRLTAATRDEFADRQVGG